MSKRSCVKTQLRKNAATLENERMKRREKEKKEKKKEGKIVFLFFELFLNWLDFPKNYAPGGGVRLQGVFLTFPQENTFSSGLPFKSSLYTPKPSSNFSLQPSHQSILSAPGKISGLVPANHGILTPFMG